MIDPSTLRRQRHDVCRRDVAVLEAAAAARQAEEREERCADPLCAVCEGELPPRTGRRRSSVCPACQAEGYVPARCKGCGGPLQRIDQYGPKDPERRGCCKACRGSMAEATDRRELARAAGRRSAELRAARAAAGANGIARLCTGLVPVPGSSRYSRACRAVVDQPLERCTACGTRRHPELAA